jgi:hypothetical protein
MERLPLLLVTADLIVAVVAFPAAQGQIGATF